MDDFGLHRRRRTTRILPCLVAAMVLATLAHAQRERFEIDGVSIAFDRPAAWHLIEAPASTAPFTITVADGEGAAIGHALDYASEQLAGTIVVAVGPVAAHTIISAADRERRPDVQPALDLVVRSFLPPSVARSDHVMLPDDATAPDAPTNPLDPPTQNPLDRAAPPEAYAVVDPFVGRFADPDVTLVLALGEGGYVGEIVVLGAPYPVSAALVDGRLDGAFRDGAQSFAVSAELTGDTLVLESDGARFVLQRRP